MENDILRRLYSGEYFPEQDSRPDNSKMRKERDIMEESHEKIMIALKEKYGDDEANQIDNDFMGAYSCMINEDMFNVFKEGFHLGFDIVMASFNRKD